VPNFPIRTYEGSHREIGLRRGKELSATLRVPPASGARKAFAAACMERASELHPPLIDLFDGMIEGSGFDRGDFMVMFFARQQSMLGCTVIAAAPPLSAAGGTIVARNYDWFTADREWREARILRPRGFPACAAFTHHWWGNPDVVTENGLCVFVASLMPKIAEEPGIQWNLLVDAAVERCASTAEAVALLSAAPHLRSMNYLVADSGSAAVVEASAAGTKVRWAKDGFCAATNIALGENPERILRAESDDKILASQVPFRSVHSAAGMRRALKRYRRAARLATNASATDAGDLGKVTEDDILRVLQDHDVPVCCGHASPYIEFNWATIWTSVCRPAERAMKVSADFACRPDFATLRGM